MCGRFTLATPGEIVAEVFGVEPPVDLPARYNIAPTQPVAIVRQRRDGGRELVQAHWGLVPRWAPSRDTGARMINARAETAAERPAFREALAWRRCLIPADGFYEWRKIGSRKQPYLIRRRDGRPFALAGLWERWQGAGETLESCTILTCAPNEVVAPLHDRMPVILAADAWGSWLDRSQRDPAGVLPLLVPHASEPLEAVPVSPRVNDPANEDPGCREPLMLR